MENEKESHDQALKYADKALDLDNKFIDGFVAKGRILTNRKKGENWLKDAIKEFDRALKISPDNEKVIYYKGESYAAGLQFSDAETMFGKVVDQKGGFAKRCIKMSFRPAC